MVLKWYQNILAFFLGTHPKMDFSTIGTKIFLGFFGGHTQKWILVPMVLNDFRTFDPHTHMVLNGIGSKYFSTAPPLGGRRILLQKSFSCGKAHLFDVIFGNK